MVIYFIMLYARSAINQRKYPRHTVLKEGKIVSSTMNGVINVTIRDLSVGGAQIQLPSYIGMPQEFSLMVTSENLLYPAVAKWRTGGATGIAFVGEPFLGSVLRYINAPRA
jgi:PilZ domain